MDEQQPVQTPPTPHSAFSKTPLVVLAVILLVAGGAAVAYFIGHWPSVANFISPTTPATENNTGITWQSLIGEKSTTTLIATTTVNNTVYAASYAVYGIGTFTQGQYAGSRLYIATATDNSTPTDTLNTYVFYIGDTSGKPVAWWDYYGEHSFGMGDLNLPAELLDATKLASTTLPAQLGQSYNRSFDSNGAAAVIGSDLIVPSNSATFSPVGSTINGEPVIKSPEKPSGVAFNNLQYDYYVQTPFGAFYPLTLEPNFVDEYSYDSPANLTWQTGSTTVETYNYGHYLYGVSDCFTSFKDTASLVASFIRTGTTNNGDAIYEINPKGHDDVYQCLYPKTQRYNYDPATQTSSSYYPTTYQEFLTTHPVFFWKHQYGEWMAFGRSDVVPAAEKAKPVIYLYPTKAEEINVNVDPVGGFTKTNPPYGNGWDVVATPNGVLTNLQDGKTYQYLFWEGGATGVVDTPQKGFVVAQSDVPALLTDKLTLLGLNAQERADFLAFWVPRLNKTPYYFITFVSRSEIDRVAPLAISPTPDTIIRVLMDYKSLDKPVTVAPLQITPTPRKGFTVVEWGGIVR